MKNKNIRKLRYVSGNPQNAGFCTIYPTASGGLGLNFSVSLRSPFSAYFFKIALLLLKALELVRRLEFKPIYCKYKKKSIFFSLCILCCCKPESVICKYSIVVITCGLKFFFGHLTHYCYILSSFILP
jgi:hypothetical protein